MAEEVLGSGISKGVTDQLLLRESLIGENSKSKEHLMFFNSNGAWVRLASSVDTLTQKESGEFRDNPLIIQERQEEDKKFGSSILASNNVLFGGMYPELQKPQGGLLSEKWHKPQNIDDNGFILPGNIKDANYHNYESTGYRPVPGITSVNIKSKNTYGTLREAEVSLVVWTVEDLELMQTLYLRPGYSMLLEWGHSLKLEIEGRGSTQTVKVDSEIQTYTEFFKSQQKQQNIEKFLIQNAENSNYNYDGMYGYVSNFSWSFRSDGGYDCTVKIISKGAILESLALCFDVGEVYPIDQITVPDQEASKEERKGIFHKFRSELRKAVTEPEDALGLIKPNGPLEVDLGPGIGRQGAGNSDNFKIERIFQGDVGRLNSGEDFSVTLNSTLYGFPINYKTEVTNTENETEVYRGKKIYVPLSVILDIYNNYIALKDPTQQSESGTLTDGYKYVEFYTGWQDSDTDLANPFEKESKFLTTKYHFSINPLVCVIPGQLDNRGIQFKDPFDSCRDILQSELFENIELASTKNIGSIQISNFDLAVRSAFSKGNRKIRGDKDDILNILVSMDHVISIQDALIKENKDSDQNTTNNMTVFLKRLLEDINNSLGGVNDLDITYDESENLFFIVDRRRTPNNLSNIPKITLAGINSTLTNLNISSKISSNISSQISIAAQGGNQGTKDNIGPLLQWNRGLIDRHLPVKDIKRPGNESQIREKNEVDRLKKWLADYMEIWQTFKVATRELQTISISTGQAGEVASTRARTITVDNLKSLDETALGNLDSLASYHKIYCQKYVTQYYFKYRDNKKPPPGVIPVELSFTTIGIAGLKIGQAFGFSRGVLPKTYADDFGFIITGLDHSITNNKWTTDVKTQFFCLKPPSDTVVEEFTKLFEECSAINLPPPPNETSCRTAYPELRIVEVTATNIQPDLLPVINAVRFLSETYPPRTARAVFALMVAEARSNNVNFSSAGGNNFAGFQTDNARWGGGIEVFFNGQFCRVDSGGVNRMFASFKTPEAFMAAAANRVKAKGFDGENAVAWTNTYIQKWWSPAAKAEYTEGTQVFREKQRIYERAMKLYDANLNAL